MTKPKNLQKKLFYLGKNTSRHQALLSQQVFSSSNPPPQHICMEKINLRKQNVTTAEASLSIRPLKHFIGPYVRARAAGWYSLTCDTNTHPPWSRSRTRCHTHAGEGKRDPPSRGVKQKTGSGLEMMRQWWSKTLHTVWGVTTAIHEVPMVGTCSTSPSQNAQLGACISMPLHSDPIKIKGPAGLLLLKFGQTKMSHKYQKSSNMQIYTARNQNIYPTPACWRI